MVISIVLFIIKIYYLIKDNQLREKNHLNGLSTVNFIIALFKWFKMQDLKKKDFVTKKAAPKKRDKLYTIFHPREALSCSCDSKVK